MEKRNKYTATIVNKENAKKKIIKIVNAKNIYEGEKIIKEQLEKNNSNYRFLSIVYGYKKVINE